MGLVASVIGDYRAFDLMRERRKQMNRTATLFAAIAACAAVYAHAHGDHGHPRKAPAASYEKPPQQPPKPDDYVIKLEQMATFYDAPGEFGHVMIGKDHGFKQLSFIITETRPGGGPPLHAHESEEAHVLLSGTATYFIEDPETKQRKIFTVHGPYIVRIPAGYAHTFLNAGTTPFNLTAAFPDSQLTYREIGPNPLTKRIGNR
jgi:mannose-6-phosphate isomerase-like protein (cupin superfamily)